MGKCMFAYPDRTVQTNASVSTLGTAWDNTLGLDNLQSRLKSKVARSTAVTPGSTLPLANTKFGITLPMTQAVRMVAILNHNASYMQATPSTVTLKFSNTLMGNSELGSYTRNFWDAYYPAGAPLEWGDNDFWGGRLSMADAEDFKPSPDFWIVLPDVINCRFISVEIDDQNNPSGFFQLGRCFVATGWQPAINLDYGCSMYWQQDVDKVTSLGGVDYFNIKSQGREISGSLSDMSIMDGMVLVFDAQRRLGVEGELFFIFDIDDTVMLYKQRAMLCRHAEITPLEFPYFDGTSGAFKLTEVR